MAIGGTQMACAGHEEHPAQLGGRGEFIEHLLLSFEREQRNATGGQRVGVDVICAGGSGGDEFQMHRRIQISLAQWHLHRGIENGMHLGQQWQHGVGCGGRREHLETAAESGGDGGYAGCRSEIQDGQDFGHCINPAR